MRKQVFREIEFHWEHEQPPSRATQESKKHEQNRLDLSGLIWVKNVGGYTLTSKLKGNYLSGLI